LNRETATNRCLTWSGRDGIYKTHIRSRERGLGSWWLLFNDCYYYQSQSLCVASYWTNKSTRRRRGVQVTLHQKRRVVGRQVRQGATTRGLLLLLELPLISAGKEKGSIFFCTRLSFFFFSFLPFQDINTGDAPGPSRICWPGTRRLSPTHHHHLYIYETRNWRRIS
jgi:hypothetical protein